MKIQFILKSLVLISIALLVLELAATGASLNVQNNASFSGVPSSVGQQNALFSGVIPMVGTNLGIGLFSGQIPIVANLNTRKITNVIRALDLTESAVATKQLNASLGNMTTSLNVTASQNATNTVNSTLIQNVTTSLNSTTPQNTTKI